MPSPVILKDISSWLKDIDSDMLIWAIDEAVRNEKRNWKYINAILKNHFSAGRKTLSDVQSAQRTNKKRTAKRSAVFDKSAYDYSEIEKIILEKARGT